MRDGYERQITADPQLVQLTDNIMYAGSANPTNTHAGIDRRKPTSSHS